MNIDNDRRLAIDGLLREMYSAHPAMNVGAAFLQLSALSDQHLFSMLSRVYSTGAKREERFLVRQQRFGDEGVEDVEQRRFKVPPSQEKRSRVAPPKKFPGEQATIIAPPPPRGVKPLFVDEKEGWTAPKHPLVREKSGEPKPSIDEIYDAMWEYIEPGVAISYNDLSNRLWEKFEDRIRSVPNDIYSPMLYAIERAVEEKKVVVEMGEIKKPRGGGGTMIPIPEHYVRLVQDAPVHLLEQPSDSKIVLSLEEAHRLNDIFIQDERRVKNRIASGRSTAERPHSSREGKDAWNRLRDAGYRLKSTLLSTEGFDIPPIPEETGARKFYRGGPSSSMPRGKTAWDIISYEIEELGNVLVLLQRESVLRSIPANRVFWLARRPEDAARYGRVEVQTVDKYRLLARDSEGGFLVEELPIETGAQMAFVDESYTDMVELPDHLGLYIRWRLPDMGTGGVDWWMRTPRPSVSLEAAKKSCHTIRRMFGLSNAWDFAVVEWDGTRFNVVWEDPDSRYTEEKMLEEYHAEAFN